MLRAAWMVGCAAITFSATVGYAAGEPEVFPHDGFVNLVRMPSGEIWRLRAFPSGNGGNGTVRYQVSTDNGTTWGPNQDIPTAPGHFIVGGANPIPALVRQPDNSIDLNFSRFANLDLWFYGNNGSGQLTSQMLVDGQRIQHHMMMQTNTGRIIVPLADLNGSSSGPPFGRFNSRVIYSDDYGATWTMSSAQLRIPVPAGHNGSGDGAIEPYITQLADDKLWMTFRTQTGRHYESFSTDNGTTWTDPTPSNFYATTSWLRVVRLDDGPEHDASDPYDAPLVAVWTNGTLAERHGNKVWYTGRDTVHAAISLDNGESWLGYREVYLDPARSLPGGTGDAGATLPFPIVTTDNRILMKTGQATGTAFVRFDPRWLLETTRSENFEGADPLGKSWSVFKHYGEVGEVAAVKRPRIAGAALVADPADNGNDVLRLRRAQKAASDGLTVYEPGDANYNLAGNTLLDGDGAMWNFAMAKRGVTTARIRLQDGFDGAFIGFNDRFFNPNDPQGEEEAIFGLDIGGDGMIGSTQLLTNQWYDLAFEWDLATHLAHVLVDGQQVAVLQQQNRALPGPSYLRLRSTADGLDLGGYLIDDIAQVGLSTGPVRESLRMNAAQANVALTPNASWTSIRFDDYVPNTNVSAGNTSGNGPTGSFAGPFMGFVNPTTGANAVGLVIESASGNVVFSDGTSSQVTSDLVGATLGQTVTLRFVNPDDPSQAAVVSQVAWRFGSTVADNVQVKLLDVHGNELPNYLFQALADGTSGSVGFQAFEDLKLAPAIHAIQLTGLSSDTWLIGSFNLDPALADLAFTGFTLVPVPEPGMCALLLAGLLTGVRVRGRA